MKHFFSLSNTSGSSLPAARGSRQAVRRVLPHRTPHPAAVVADLTLDLAPRRRLRRRRCLQRRYHRHVERRTGGRARRPRAGRKDLACGRWTKHAGGGDSERTGLAKYGQRRALDTEPRVLKRLLDLLPSVW
jgi:hypothetical protein